ncbi:Primase alpha helix C-terminal domain protein (plasmid) [Carboxydocella thermautotrophica]|nr:Primase alpha helix C-terminal domain protein [Carboxydocella thermautotrophica]
MNLPAQYRSEISAQEALHFLLKESLIDTGKENWKPGHIFLADLMNNTLVYHRSYKTFNSLYKQIERATYFTPNAFYRNDRRDRQALRWLNAIFVDIDDPETTLIDILEAVDAAGLPVPTIINKSPNGYHVYWKIEPVWATPKAIGLYNALTEAVAQAINADTNAVGAERYLRIPKNVLFFEPNIYNLSLFLDWRDINQTEVIEDKPGAAVCILPKGILKHPAFKKMLQGYDFVGYRDHAAFTLALAMKVEGYSEEQALEILMDWNKRNTQEDPLTIADLKTKIRSAYKDKYRGPSAKWVQKLTGIPFHYRLVSKKKTREERKYLHLDEIKQDILNLLRGNGGIIQISQAKLAEKIKAPLRSVKKALQALKEEGVIEQKTTGQGRAAKTEYRLTAAARNKVVTAKKRNSHQAQQKLTTPYQLTLEVVNGEWIFYSSKSPPHNRGPDTG